ncbi:MAG: GIY-YIG nuclease family protein [Pseudomonadota bacterium]
MKGEEVPAFVKGKGGSYALLFYCPADSTVPVGRLGQLSLIPGYYVYCGSAFGPGGVKSRTDHHRKISRRPHWHIDYLRPSLQLLEIWYSLDRQNREHQWAEQLGRLRGATAPFTGFGSTDCLCPTHFLRLGYKPSFAGFRRRVRAADPAHLPFYHITISRDGGGRSE